MFYYVDFFVFFVLRHWWVSQVYTQAEPIWSAKKDIKTNYTCITTVKLILRERRSTRISGRKSVQSTDLDIMNGPVYSLCALALGLALHIFATQHWWVPSHLLSALQSNAEFMGCCFGNSTQLITPRLSLLCLPLPVSRVVIRIFGWK